jgi:hypothetical protein
VQVVDGQITDFKPYEAHKSAATPHLATSGGQTPSFGTGA